LKSADILFGSGLLSQYVMPHVKQVIIDAKEGPPKYEEGMAIDIFSVVRYQTRECIDNLFFCVVRTRTG
jgi:hypothetical protein